jgi:hypothetical protein
MQPDELQMNDSFYIPFPELGSGSQFHAYDLHDGRVLKLPLTKQETTVVVAKRRHNMMPLTKEQQATIETRVQTIVGGKGRIPAMLTHALYDPKPFLALLGNPVLLDADTVLPEDTDDKGWGVGRVAYTQDRLMMVGSLLQDLSGLSRLKRGDIARMKAIIDQYAERIYQLWDYGVSDYVFKIGDTGLNKENVLTFADLGEFSSDGEYMRSILKDRRWLHSTDPTKIDFPQIPKELQEYYIKTLDNAFTEKAFIEHWRSKHICSSCRPAGDVISTFIAAKVAEIDYVDRW